MLSLVIDSRTFSKRRDRFMKKLLGKAAVIPAASMVTHHADCEYPFRQNSDFWYLTGFDEPDAVALFLPHRPKGEQYVLFVLPKKPSIEVWNGFRWGIRGVLDNFDVDIAHSIDELSEKSGVINWKKHFIPRDKNVNHEHFDHDLLPTGIDYFRKRGFQIFDQWMLGDDTIKQEHIAFMKTK